MADRAAIADAAARCFATFAADDLDVVAAVAPCIAAAGVFALGGVFADADTFAEIGPFAVAGTFACAGTFARAGTFALIGSPAVTLPAACLFAVKVTVAGFIRAVLPAAGLAADVRPRACFGCAFVEAAFALSGTTSAGVFLLTEDLFISGGGGADRPFRPFVMAVLVLAMESILVLISVGISIDRCAMSFQVLLMKLIAEGLPTLIRTPVGSRLPIARST